jgi:CheY-like chemotaxis protein
VRIIGSSGYASSTSQSKIASCGVRHFLSKPYSADLLLQTIREVLDADKPA